ncbi:probable 2-oxoglutarate-dependent dioxygenase AOP1 [Lycium barbarum]|uniref:probable 2-oxoglutarate-dependent dioxygenase AOP1 n=1 Tax=Lycium barbarum TaxID=112863 RepID=UPI00293EEB06|nr:probable 2-oxoglutarate-dependent dioxygenase AOP1 [Lycium barbarum]
MASKIPSINFCNAKLKTGSAEWESTRSQVLQALQEYGCFEAIYDKVSSETREAMFANSKEIFEFPLETKLKNLSDKPLHGYKGMIPNLPSYESLCIPDLLESQSVETFANIFWPNGKSDFCNAVRNYSKPLMELDEMVTMMVLESIGMKNYIDEFLNSSFFRFRFTRYKKLAAQSEKENNKLGLVGHTDGGWLTIISQNGVNGLQVKKKEEWIDVNIAPNSFVVLSGDSFVAWTNGRLHSPVHRVTMGGDSDRFSIQLFSVPKSDYIIEAPKELVDEQHPLLFKPYDITGYFEYIGTKAGARAGGDAFKIYCGV